jgi:hypothetical protein
MKRLIPLFLLVPLVVFAAGCDLAGITITPSTQAPAINSFGADPLTIAAGESSTLSWSVVGAATVSIDQGIGNVALAGSRAVMPSATTVYTLTATNAAGTSITATAQVVVTGAPTPPVSLPIVNSFAASPPSIIVGELATLSWNVSNATSVTIDHGVGTFASSGTTLVSPATTTTYILTATNAAGSTTAMTQVIVSGAPPPPGGSPVVNYFTADPPIISAGSFTTLSWSVSNATSVTIDPGVGPVSSVGTALVSPAANTNYTLTAANAYGLYSLTIGVLVTGGGPHVAYDFVEMAPTAYWWTKIGADMVALPFPGALNDNRGFATYRNNVKLSDGNTYTRVLETHPQWVDNGWISGKYSGVYVPPGAKLRIKVGLINGANAGNVIFNIGKLGDPATINTNVFYAGGVKVLESDLSAYAGQTIDFVMNVNANGSSGQDWAAWAEAKIIY